MKFGILCQWDNGVSSPMSKTKNKIQENMKTVKTVLHRPMIMDGGKGKNFKNVVLLSILNISKK